MYWGFMLNDVSVEGSCGVSILIIMFVWINESAWEVILMRL